MAIIKIERMDVFCKVSSINRKDFFIQMCTAWAQKLTNREIKSDEVCYFRLPVPLEEVWADDPELIYLLGKEKE